LDPDGLPVYESRRGGDIRPVFFGEEMVAKIMDNEHGVILPECTGIWWKERGRNAKEANNQKTS
jgi:hypothetical protein